MDFSRLQVCAKSWENNHGSIAQINGKWYVFYHRHTGVNEFSRQAMMEPIDVAMGKDGMLYIRDNSRLQVSAIWKQRTGEGKRCLRPA